MTRHLAVFLLLSPATAGAATICVAPTGPPCETTVQAAIDRAGAGDTITIEPGIYVGRVGVPPGKDGLRLIGAGRLTTVIDPAVPGAGPIFIASHDVEFAQLGVRNGGGLFLDFGVRGLWIHDTRFVNTLVSPNFASIFSFGGSTGLRIVGNEFRGGAWAILLNGLSDGTVIRQNVFRQVQGGISAVGDNVEVAGNRISNAGIGISVDGPNVRVMQNVLDTIPDSGIVSRGPNSTVTGNRLTNVTAAALEVACTGCLGGLVADNVIEVASRGLVAAADAPGLVVARNRVSRTSDAAYSISGTGIQVSGNLASHTGAGINGNGFRVEGTSHRLTRNVVTRAAVSGFLLAGDELTLDRNVSIDAGVSGFTAGVPFPGRPASNNVLTNNLARGSNAAGFSITGDAVGIVLTGNRGGGNRYDLCDQGQATDLSGGNGFRTTSTVCDVLQ